MQLAQQQLNQQGWSLLRGFEHDLEKFSTLVAGFCHKLTFDPAREFSNDSTQKVNAGTAAIGLHIENGNTPFPPNLVAFYSRKSAQQGSQTTLCDGAQLFNAMPAHLKKRFSAPMQVSRTLPAELWKRYVANEHPNVNQAEKVTPQHLQELMAMLPGQSGEINQQGELYYQLRFNPLLEKNGQLAFANAILGPSFNYQAPQYHFADGTLLDDKIKEQVAQLAEHFTLELAWQDGDMLLIDNTRVMHGRRAIEGNPSERQLVIAMGS
ncbi:hypothetical protein A9Q73_09565 [Bermanella sp. 47_1433_sub80_T6]|nr:hypothetical protein A9Q73_09565 [Bermanella sp. 47_1433_sub80_T6]